MTTRSTLYSSTPLANLPACRFGLLSTYPPKFCGLATFAAALEGGLKERGHRVDIVRINDGDPDLAVGLPVAGELRNGVAASIRKAAAVLSRCDTAIIQHEYGIYGGPDGAEVIDLLKAVSVPTIVVLHTVPLDPTPNQRDLLIEIASLASGVVVMTQTAHDRLIERYPIDPTKLTVIPHGAAIPTSEPFPADGPRPQLLTWGLLGPGKGIEHVIDALAALGDLRPRPRYTVAGVTHPKVFARCGDEYRHSLIERTFALKVAPNVSFDDTYRDVAQLTRFVASASVVVLPYDSRDQITSGVLVDAIAAGRPVIATGFPHAVELLSGGAGIVVPHGDPDALAQAIGAVLTDPTLLAEMGAAAARIAPTLSWSAVAEQYAALTDHLAVAAEAIAI